MNSYVFKEAKSESINTNHIFLLFYNRKDMDLHMSQDLQSYMAYRLTTGYPRAKCLLLSGWGGNDLKNW